MASSDDDYVVKLPSGDARVMSIDELDAAFDAGTIHKDTPVLAPGTMTWSTLGVLAGLEEVAAPVSPASLAPMVTSGPDVASLALDDEAAALVPRRRTTKIIGAAFAAVAVLAAGFAIQSAIGQAVATSNAQAALAAQSPLPPPPVAMPLPVARAAATIDPALSAQPATAAPAPAVATKSTKDKDTKKAKLPGATAKKKK
jgi:hypothetical protein